MESPRRRSEVEDERLGMKPNLKPNLKPTQVVCLERVALASVNRPTPRPTIRSTNHR
jgi:hypothetical protein